MLLLIIKYYTQGSVKKCFLGCVYSLPGSAWLQLSKQSGRELMQPRKHLLAEPCNIICSADLACVELVLGAVLCHLVQHGGRHVLVRQLLEDLLRALADVARPGEDESHRADGVGHQAQADLVPRVPDALPRVVAVPV